jgi:MFS family permease
MRSHAEPRLGLKENLGQFSLLVLVNAFVGAMVGMERTVLPLLAEREFGIASRASILSFLVTFGVVKALANAFSGGAADRWGRRRVLLAGWIAGIPVPFLIMLAPTWSWVVAANILLGVNQGLCWSAAIIMKVDLAGPRQRGLAIGLNESSGYLAVSLVALVTGFLAARYGLRPAPFVVGAIAAFLGLFASLFVRETRDFAAKEHAAGANAGRPAPSMRAIFSRVTWRDPSLRAVSQAGLMNNLNDGVCWGLLPLLFVSRGAGLEQAAILAAVYPAIWGGGQLVTGFLSDRYGRKWLMAGGMVLQGLALVAVAAGDRFNSWLFGMVLLGVGTALVYPTFLGAIADHSEPRWRASAIGVYRLWRDLGYAVGALVAGGIADRFGIPASVAVVGVLTVASGIVVAVSYSQQRGEP